MDLNNQNLLNLPRDPNPPPQRNKSVTFLGKGWSVASKGSKAGGKAPSETYNSQDFYSKNSMNQQQFQDLKE